MIPTASLTDRNSILNPTAIPNSHIANIANIPIPNAAKTADVAENINAKMMKGFHKNDVGVSTPLHTAVLILLDLLRFRKSKPNRNAYASQTTNCGIKPGNASGRRYNPVTI